MLEINKARSQQILEKQRIENELMSLTFLKNKLDKEDRLNHVKLVKDSMENKQRQAAMNQRKNALLNKEKVTKRSYDSILEQRYLAKQNQMQRHQ